MSTTGMGGAELDGSVSIKKPPIHNEVIAAAPDDEQSGIAGRVHRVNVFKVAAPCGRNLRNQVEPAPGWTPAQFLQKGRGNDSGGSRIGSDGRGAGKGVHIAVERLGFRESCANILQIRPCLLRSKGEGERFRWKPNRL